MSRERFSLQFTPTNQLSHQVQDALICQSPWALTIEMAVNTSEKEEANDENICCSLWISPKKHT